MNKVIGEKTRPTNEPPLCLTCNYSTVVRGTRMGDDLVACRIFRDRVRFHVTECSSYDDSRVIPVYRLEETAWRWYSDRFVSPKEFARLEEAEDEKG